jgi:hypothetical protein
MTDNTRKNCTGGSVDKLVAKKPLNISKVKTIKAGINPKTLKTLVEPGLPLPNFLMSFLNIILPNRSADGKDPIKYDSITKKIKMTIGDYIKFDLFVLYIEYEAFKKN